MMVRGSAAVLGMVLLTACAGSPATTQDGPVTAGTFSSTVAPRNAGPSEGVSSPPGIDDCGTFVVRLMDTLPATARTCFLGAVHAKRLARLTVSWTTAEGDPIPTTYLSDATGRVRVDTDYSQDKFAQGGGLDRQICTGPAAQTPVLSFTRCSTLNAPAR